MSLNFVPVFVYGTLRVGHGNYGWCKGAVAHADEGATTTGRIWFAYEGGTGYPVAKFDDADPENVTIIGDVLWFDGNDQLFREVVRMEEGAGYEIRTITVEHEGEELEVLAFHYPRTPGGKEIRSGDWATEANRRITTGRR